MGSADLIASRGLDLSALREDEQRDLLALLQELDRRDKERRLELYRPYQKQKKFHDDGKRFRERLLRAGNQNGKSYSVGTEWAFHLTGLYPEWWDGRRWDRPIVAWASSDTAETTRDNPQRVLLGIVGEMGTGAIPAQLLGDYGNAQGVADLVDYIRVKHVSGGWSLLRFKYYAQGRSKWQGPPVDAVWFDEEPPEDIYDEGLARTIATGGMAALSFTPLLGMSNVVRRFLVDPTDDRSDTNMTIEDAEHIPAEERARIIASFAPHEREARARGIPTLGSGRIYPVAEEMIKVTPFALPAHWARIAAIDFGWDHPTAISWMAWDRDADVIYVYDCYRVREQTPNVHAAALRARGAWIPVMWPHDGLQHDKQSGSQLADTYRKHGANLHQERATFEDGSIGVEAGVMKILDRMQRGQFKVFSHLEDWFEEFRLYHRKDGKIVKEFDDLMDSSRYGIMGLRHAITEPRPEYFNAGGFVPIDPVAGY